MISEKYWCGIYSYLHCVRSFSWCATTLDTLTVILCRYKLLASLCNCEKQQKQYKKSVLLDRFFMSYFLCNLCTYKISLISRQKQVCFYSQKMSKTRCSEKNGVVEWMPNWTKWWGKNLTNHFWTFNLNLLILKWTRENCVGLKG